MKPRGNADLAKVLDKPGAFQECLCRHNTVTELMKQKELANVLIKVLGLYFLVDGGVRVISGALNLLGALTTLRTFGSFYTWVTPFTGMLLAAIGLLLILLSRAIADILFKDE